MHSIRSKNQNGLQTLHETTEAATTPSATGHTYNPSQLDDRRSTINQKRRPRPGARIARNERARRSTVIGPTSASAQPDRNELGAWTITKQPNYSASPPSTTSSETTTTQISSTTSNVAKPAPTNSHDSKPSSHSSNATFTNKRHAEPTTISPMQSSVCCKPFASTKSTTPASMGWR